MKSMPKLCVKFIEPIFQTGSSWVFKLLTGHEGEMLWHRNKFWLKTFIQGRGEHGNNLKRLQVVCLVQKQWIHSSTSRAWKSESNHMKRPHIKEGTSSNWGRIRRTSLSPNEVLVKTKHFSERYCTFCRTPPCAFIQKKSIQNLVHSCETENSTSRLFYYLSSFPALL